MKRGMIIVLATLVLGVLASSGFAGNVEEGEKAFEAGDYVKAHKLWLVEAEKGNPSAQHNLGIMYDKGQGVTQDFKEAVKWYRLAAEQGNANAQCNLGVMYAHGEGVLQSYEKAYAWWLVAATNGNEDARHNMEIAQQGSMTTTQIERGQQIAKEILLRIQKQ